MCGSRGRGGESAPNSGRPRRRRAARRQARSSPRVRLLSSSQPPRLPASWRGGGRESSARSLNGDPYFSPLPGLRAWPDFSETEANARVDRDAAVRSGDDGIQVEISPFGQVVAERRQAVQEVDES